jgi:hypothetical protein
MRGKMPARVLVRAAARKAFPWETAPTYLVRDNDGAYGPAFRRRWGSETATPRA